MRDVMAALPNLVISILRMAGHVSIAAALRHTARDPARARSGCSQARSNGQYRDNAKTLGGGVAQRV